MAETRERLPSEVLKRGYSDDEVSNIYALGRLYLEGGHLASAETLFVGLINLAPDFYPAWIGMGYLQIQGKDFESAADYLKEALRRKPDSIEAMLLISACLISSGDYSTAGTYLGEVRENIESGGVSNNNLLRFYHLQLARYSGARG